MAASDAPAGRGASTGVSNVKLALLLGAIALAIYVLFVASGMSGG